MIHEPKRKKYLYKIPTLYGDVFLRFTQALAEETEDFMYLVTDDVGEEEKILAYTQYRETFFNKHYAYTKRRRFFPKIVAKRLAKVAFVRQLSGEIYNKYH